MKPFVLEPAKRAHDANGTPYSERYGDIYHSRDSGPGQAAHVFLRANGLPERWRGQSQFTIAETGFGLGVNFLTTLQHWLADPQRCARLHYIAVEKHPFATDDLRALHAGYRWPAALADALLAQWPMLVPGTHRLEFADGAVTLTLTFGEVADAAAGWRCGVDAFYLDGFAPARNPEMWSVQLFKRLARVAQPAHTTFATYTAAAAVRTALAEAGFTVERLPGYGTKRDMIAGRFTPRWPLRHPPFRVPQRGERRAIVLGAGLAGAAVAHSLVRRGWHCHLIDRHETPAREASSLPAGAYHPLIAADDSMLARLTRAGFVTSRRLWPSLRDAGTSPEGEVCGLLQIARHDEEAERMARAVEGLRLPADYVQYLDCEQASAAAGCRLKQAALLFPHTGWMRAASLVQAQLSLCAATGRLTAHFGREVTAVRREDDGWVVTDSSGAAIARAPVLVFANADGAAGLMPLGTTLQRVRGQITLVPVTGWQPPRIVLTGSGYAIPLGSHVLTGATYETGDTEVAEAQQHAGNVARLAQLLGPLPFREPPKLTGAAATRCVSLDRLPLIGAVPDVPAAAAARTELSGAHLADLPRLPDCYCAIAYASRGLTWAGLGGEVIAAELAGEPPVLDGTLLDAIDPGRFALSALRRGHPL